MRNMQDTITEISEEVALQTEKAIFEQLQELISRDLLVVEARGVELYQDMTSDKIKIGQNIRLKLKDQEYIEKLETELEEYKKIITTLRNTLP